MFIQVKDIDQSVEPKTENIFIIQTYTGDELYISRSYVGHKLTSYTMPEQENAIVYFNRQQAENALATEFKFTQMLWKISAIPVNSEVKADAKKTDAVKRFLKNERRREAQKKREEANQ